MRRVIDINENWEFIKEGKSERVDLPHCWNAVDGQDGGNDYYRGVCLYGKELPRVELGADERVYLEFEGANAIAEVSVNGTKLCRHEGGYSAFRVDITEALGEENRIEVLVDNGPSDSVYPQKADFTFYGGIYRDVRLIIVPETHFDLDYFGAPGIQITPKVNGADAEVTVLAYVKGDAESVRVTVDGLNSIEAARISESEGNVQVWEAKLLLTNVHLWNGRKDPYLYHADAELTVDSVTADRVGADFGCRTFSFDPEQGFFLNGEPYPLRGVSRHQDFAGVGNAVTRQMQDLDMELILETGATSVRLAHYQHSRYFYDLCDRKGLIVWAEIPYISVHMPGGRANTVSQMRELIAQNYNHPSIVLWALSNEIGVGGVTEDLLENHRILNDLAHSMDSTRLTAMANAYMLPMDSPLNDIPDIFAYNLYFGWYEGELQDNDAFFEKFHKAYPDRCIGLTEYGADAFHGLQSSAPEQGDYSEQFQALYHEYMLRMFHRMPYLWGTYVWNMFDFGADGRDEAGDYGKNHKGLVSMDRRVKKDAFYAYKAWWSDEPFVHLCGSRYADRTEEETEIKVYSNQKKVALYVDGACAGEQEGDHVFVFKVRISGDHEILAKSGGLEDSMKIRRVSERNPKYFLKASAIHNWFAEPGMEIVPGHFSINDTLEAVARLPEGRALVDEMVNIARAARGDVAKSVKRTPEMEAMLLRNTFIKFFKMAGGAITPEMVVEINRKLTKMKKPE